MTPEPHPTLAEALEPEETLVAWGAAKWRENPYQQSAQEAEGLLCLTTNRLIFETPTVQPLVSLDLRSFDTAEITTKRRGVLLVLTHDDGERKSFWCDLALAEQVASVIGRRPAP